LQTGVSLCEVERLRRVVCLWQVTYPLLCSQILYAVRGF
jgi:hypothetical protein